MDDAEAIRPVVPLTRAGSPGWLIALGFAVLAVMLFAALEARRRAAQVLLIADVAPRNAFPPAPPLAIPDAPVVQATPALLAPVRKAPVKLVLAKPSPVLLAPPPLAPPPHAMMAPSSPPPPPQRFQEPAMVVDLTQPDTGRRAPGDVGGPQVGQDGEATVRAVMVRNQATTILQGTLIPAVLETAIDSTRPGATRALISRDILGYDGTQVLVPRGSRLIGEYKADVAPGQNRLVVNWVRLIRPDGASIRLASPATDPLGRGGVRGKVNSHFIERFGGAILQSLLTVGTNLATSAASGTVIVGVPGAFGNATQSFTPSNPQPTITVRQGTEITIFAARDLDFTNVTRPR